MNFAILIVRRKLKFMSILMVELLYFMAQGNWINFRQTGKKKVVKNVMIPIQNPKVNPPFTPGFQAEELLAKNKPAATAIRISTMG